MPLPSRNTSAGRPVFLDTALLPCSSLPPAAKETRSDCLSPDGCAPRGNVRYIAATLAAAKILQTGSASTDMKGTCTATDTCHCLSFSAGNVRLAIDDNYERQRATTFRTVIFGG